jgi:uncharacterized cupredoxin-like copper-binding protein
MKHSRLLSLFGAALLALPVAAQSPQLPGPIRPSNPPGGDAKNVDPDGPRIASPRATFDFGEAPQNDKVEYDFILENRGKKPLRIDKVNATCGCTVGQPEKNELAPGESTKVKTTFNTQTFNGPVTKTLIVDSNDTTQPRFNLNVTGRVVQAFRTNTTEVNFGSLRKGTKFQDQSFDVLTPGTLNAALLDAQSDHTAVKARIDRLPAGSPARGFRVTVSIEGNPPVGQIRGKLTLITDLPSQKQFEVPFVAQIDGEVAVTPRQFSFGNLKSGETATKEIRITKTGEAPLAIESLQMKTGGLFTAETVEVKAGREYVIKISPAKDIKVGYQRETLTIKTNVPGEELVQVYFYAMVK